MPQMMPMSWLVIYLSSLVIFYTIMCSWSMFFVMPFDPKKESSGVESYSYEFW